MSDYDSYAFENYFPSYNPQKDPVYDHQIDKKSVKEAYNKIEQALLEKEVDTLKIDKILNDFKFFIDTTDYIDYKTFIRTFSHQMDRFFENLRGESYAVIQTEKMVSKSNVWMINLFLSLLGDRPSPEYITTIDHPGIKEKELPDVKRLVYIDDVIYTGEQMYGYITYLGTYGPDFLKEKAKYVIVAYSTEEAAKRLQKIDAFVYAKILLTLKDKMRASGKQSLMLCDSPLTMGGDIFLEKSNTIFQHKLADIVSSFPSIYSGNFCAFDGKRVYRFELNEPLIENCDKTNDQCFDPFYKDIDWQKSYTKIQKKYIRKSK